MSYDQLDAIADVYIPLLILISVGVVVFAFHEKSIASTKNLLVVLGLGICQTYGIMLLDNTLSIWPSFGLDYSTHTSLALVFVVFLSFVNRIYFAGSVFSMLIYVVLMLYQEYHSVLDIVTTTIVVLPGLIWLNIKWGISGYPLITDQF